MMLSMGKGLLWAGSRGCDQCSSSFPMVGTELPGMQRLLNIRHLLQLTMVHTIDLVAS